MKIMINLFSLTIACCLFVGCLGTESTESTPLPAGGNAAEDGHGHDHDGDDHHEGDDGDGHDHDGDDHHDGDEPGGHDGDEQKDG